MTFFADFATFLPILLLAPFGLLESPQPPWWWERAVERLFLPVF